LTAPASPWYGIDTGQGDTLPRRLNRNRLAVLPLHKIFGATTNVLERLNREIRRRTKAVGIFPDGHSALMLVRARLRHVVSTVWGTKRYMRMKALDELQNTSVSAG